MKPIIYQGSGGTIGDIFFSSLPMFHQHKMGRKIYVALPRSLKPFIRELYDCHTFLDGIIEMDDIQESNFLKEAAKLDMEPCLFIKSIQFIKDAKFYKLSEWFNNPKQPTFDSNNCIAIQIVSTSFRERPKIKHWDKYEHMIKQSKLQPFFHGTKEDEIKILEEYPGIRDMCKDEYWRFGKDDVLQTIANIKNCHSVIASSSWSAYVAVLQMVPAIELWPPSMWLFYTPRVRQMLGNPIHYLQDTTWAEPMPELLNQCVPMARDVSYNLYN